MQVVVTEIFVANIIRNIFMFVAQWHKRMAVTRLL